ncbi:Caspase domain-containing protein [Almyronema epifaneia]|uniref:Caspase domain-containing protein n=1 Tax=Almyronema epifaneia S1 TaxID=2991925 RepID=A0ABW6IGQ7_9CYAN
MRQLAFWGVTATLAVGSALIGVTLAGDRDLETGLSASLSSQSTPSLPQFLVVAGGPVPGYNEIALEKNVLYFQRTLAAMGVDPGLADIFFANGNDGQATVRYLDAAGQERFKPPAIPHLQGAASVDNLLAWLTTAQTAPQDCSTFFYFTGHGGYNAQNEDNNTLLLWGDRSFSVQELATQLDQLPTTQPFVTMMAQCFAGSFANVIYEGGNPENPVALQTRCGFFATVSDRPSVGCTPEVNEADYQDYSSSFFAGLSGISRTGAAVPSADYDQDGTVTYAEAHAFAKVDEATADWPISTSEAWLQRQASGSAVAEILSLPIATLQHLARPEQQFVIESLSARMQLDTRLSFRANARQLPPRDRLDEVEQAYLMRLQMELTHVGMEQKIRQRGDTAAIAILQKLLTCEAGSWDQEAERVRQN